MKEIKSLTGVRGIAALYVLCGHIGFLQNKDGVLYRILPIRNTIDHGYISVDLFFILSGFVLMLMYKEKFKNGYNQWFKTFIKKRAVRIIPLYLFCLLIYFLISSFLPSKESEIIMGANFWEILCNILLVQTIIGNKVFITTSWSLSTEWIAYFIFPIICFIATKMYFKSERRILLFIIFICCCLFFIAQPHTNNLDNVIPFQRAINEYQGFRALFRCIVEVLLGSFIFNCSQNCSLYKYQGLILFLLIGFISFTFYDYITVLIFAFLVLSLAEDKGFLSKFFSSNVVYKLGLWSYSIYLLHPIIIGPFRDLLYETLVKSKFSKGAFPISLLVSISATIFFSFLSYTFIEVPAKKKLNSLLIKKI